MRVKSVAVRSESPWWERYSICVCVMVFLLACFKACSACSQNPVHTYCNRKRAYVLYLDLESTHTPHSHAMCSMCECVCVTSRAR